MFEKTKFHTQMEGLFYAFGRKVNERMMEQYAIALEHLDASQIEELVQWAKLYSKAWPKIADFVKEGTKRGWIRPVGYYHKGGRIIYVYCRCGDSFVLFERDLVNPSTVFECLKLKDGLCITTFTADYVLKNHKNKILVLPESDPLVRQHFM